MRIIKPSKDMALFKWFDYKTTPHAAKQIKWFGFLAVLYFICTNILRYSSPENIIVLKIVAVICVVRCLCDLSIIKKHFIKGLIFSLAGTAALPFNNILNSISAGSYFRGAIEVGLLFVQIFLIVINIFDILQKNYDSVTVNNKLTASLFFVIPFTSLALYWKQVFPYIIATDTDWQLEQIATGAYSDVHPAAHTLFIKLILMVYNSPAAVVFVQIAFIVLITGFAFLYFYKKGVSDKILMPLLIVWSCLFSVKTFTMYIVKDVFYSAALILLTFMLVKLMNKEKKPSVFDIILTGVSLAGVFLFRHNGIIVVFFTAIALVYLGIKYYKRTLIVLLIMLAVVIPVKTVVYDAFNVTNNDNGTKYALPAKAIVSVVKNHGVYTDEQLEKIEQLMPSEAININYHRKEGQYLIWRDLMEDVNGYDYTFAESLEGKEALIVELFFELLPKNFFIMTWDIIGSMSLMIQFQPSFLMHNMTYMFILAVFMAALLLKCRKKYLIPFIPAFANIASIIISNISFEERYAYPTVMCFAILTAYSFMVYSKGELKIKKRDKNIIKTN